MATRHSGIEQAVIHGETGFLVEEHDMAGMAKCMMQLAQDSMLAGKMGKAARAWISREYSMEKSIGSLWNVIEQAIHNAEPGDTILIAGKGHEDYQLIGSDKLWFDDAVVAREILQTIGLTKGTP